VIRLLEDGVTSRRVRRTPPGQSHGEVGAAAVELVVILPLVLLLVFGTLAMGGAFFRQLSLTEAAREGARTGAATRVGLDVPAFTPGYPLDAWFEEVATVTTSTAGHWEELCVAYRGPIAFTPTGSEITRALRRTNGGGSGTYSGTPCFEDGRTERRVQVVITGRGPFSNFFTFQRILELEGGALAQYERPYTASDVAGS
jgi:hypothetical protein